MNPSEIVSFEILKLENRMFWMKILSSSIGYWLVTLWLNSIRTNASLLFVWILIIMQFALYFLIFITSYHRSKVYGLSKNNARNLFIVLAFLGRINDWELLIIPLLVIIMLILSVGNKNISKEGQLILNRK